MGVFFFQAEDGIRDLTVTGVQTCALPIFGHIMGSDGIFGVSAEEAGKAVALYWGGAMVGRAIGSALLARVRAAILRSEERRVGEECRSGEAVVHYIQNGEIESTLLILRGE